MSVKLAVRSGMSGVMMAAAMAAVCVLILQQGAAAYAAAETAETIAALPQTRMGAVVRLDGRVIGVCGSLEIAWDTVERAVETLGVPGGDNRIEGELTILPGLYTEAEVSGADELFGRLTQAGMLTVCSTRCRSCTEVIPCGEITVYDPGMPEGERVVSAEGRDGLLRYTVEERFINGVWQERRVAQMRTETQPEDRIVQVGTMKRPDWWPTGTLIQPAEGIISSEFGARGSEHHTGIDIANACGTPVYAADGGTVLFAGWKGGYGNYLIIDHEGMQTCYAHNGELLVGEGDHVVQGQQIASMGSTGRSTGPHCHFEIRVEGEFRQPRDYIEFRETLRN